MPCRQPVRADSDPGSFVPMEQDTLVRFPHTSIAFRTSLPDKQRDEFSGDETEFEENSLAITAGQQTEPDKLSVHFVDREVGLQVEALYRCNRSDVEVIKFLYSLYHVCH